MISVNSIIAFEKAIDEGKLSADKKDNNFAGNFMFMGTNKDGKNLFKNILTREYLK